MGLVCAPAILNARALSVQCHMPVLAQPRLSVVHSLPLLLLLCFALVQHVSQQYRSGE